MIDLTELIEEWAALDPVRYTSTTSQILPTLLGAIAEQNWRIRLQNHASGWQTEIVKDGDLQKHFTATDTTPTAAALGAYVLCLKDGRSENP